MAFVMKLHKKGRQIINSNQIKFQKCRCRYVRRRASLLNPLLGAMSPNHPCITVVHDRPQFLNLSTCNKALLSCRAENNKQRRSWTTIGGNINMPTNPLLCDCVDMGTKAFLRARSATVCQKCNQMKRLLYPSGGGAPCLAMTSHPCM